MANFRFSPSMAHRVSGFTLLEVMLAMLLVGMLMAMAYAGLSAGIRASDSGYRVIDQTNKVRLTQEFLRRQISKTQAVVYESDAIDGTSFMFEGGSDVMRFVSNMPGYLSHGGSYVQTLSFQRERGGMVLLFEHEMRNGYDDEDRQRGEPEPAVRLLEGIARAQFEFAWVDPETNEVEWVGDWEETASLPLMVRIALEMKPDSGVRWPEMLIPLMIDGSAPRRSPLERGGFLGG